MRVDDAAGDVCLSRCSLRHRAPFDSSDASSKCVSMTWRATPARPWFAAVYFANFKKIRGGGMQRLDPQAGAYTRPLSSSTSALPEALSVG